MQGVCPDSSMCNGQNTCATLDVEIVRVREWLREFIKVLGMVRNVTTQHRGDGTIEALHLAVLLRVVR